MTVVRTALLAALLAALSAAPVVAATPGALDPSFGRGGVLVKADIATGYPPDGGLQAIRVLADGRVLVVSTQRCGNDCNYQEIARLTPSGALDRSYQDPTHPATFASAGAVDLASDYFGGPALTGLAIAGDGRLVHGSNPSEVDWCCGPFPGPGLAVVSTGGVASYTSLAPAFTPLDTRPGGDIVGTAAGAVVRLRSDLTRDPSFGVAGATPLSASLRPFAGAATARRVRVAAVGPRGVALVTLDGAGRRLRTTRVPLRGWTSEAVPGQMVVRRDGGVVISAWLRSPQFGPPGRALLVGFRADGRLDDRFGRRGVLGIAARDTRIAGQADGRIVVLQSVSGPLSSRNDALRLQVRRLTTSGAWDRGFPTRVVARRSLHAVGGIGLDVDRRGRILIAAPALTADLSGFRLLMARLRGG